jgi:hypothetical protein
MSISMDDAGGNIRRICLVSRPEPVRLDFSSYAIEAASGSDVQHAVHSRPQSQELPEMFRKGTEVMNELLFAAGHFTRAY